MNTSVLLGLGLGAAALYLIASNSSTSSNRTATIQTANGPVTVTVPGYAASRVQQAITQGREAAIQRIMVHDHLSRADAEARYNQAAGSPGAMMRGPTMSGIGNYTRA